MHYHRLQVASWAREGLLERLLHGVYRESGRPAPASQRLHLPLCYCDQRRPPEQPASVISGQAGLAWQLADDDAIPRLPLVLVDAACRVRAPHLPFLLHRTDLKGVTWQHLRRLRVADVARCIADEALLAEATDTLLRAGVDRARNARLASGPELVRRWREIGHAGSRRMLAMAERGVFEQESDGERRAFELLFVQHPPLPDCQVVVLGRRRADFVFLSAALIIEYHGGDHDATADADATRTFALGLAGYLVIVVTKSMLADPHRLAAHIHTVRRQREQLVQTGALRLPPLPLQPERLSPLRTLHPLG